MTRALVLAALAACYHPAATTSCTVTCGPDDPCPDGMTCDGTVCHGSNDTCPQPPMVDAPAPPSEAMGPDALPANCVAGYTSNSFFPDVCVAAPGPMTVANVVGTGGTCMTTTDMRLASYCVYYGTTVTLMNVTAVGSRPLVIIATDKIVIDGTVTVGSIAGGMPGAGADFSQCSSTNGGSATSSGGGGGAGGSWQGKGGGGGGTPTLGGSADPALGLPPTTLRGGCLGGKGAGYSAALPVAGDHSGGALYLMARNEIDIASGG